MQKRALETRNKILLVATQEFSLKGLHGSRVDEIAEKAGVNKQRIYAYFGSKEALFKEVLRKSFLDISKLEEGLLNLNESDYAILGKVLLKNYFKMQQSRPDFWRLIAWENLDGGKHIDVLENIKESHYQKLRAIYAVGQKEGVYSIKVSFEVFMYTIFSLTNFYFSNQKTLAKTLNLKLDDPRIFRKIEEECIEILKF